MEYELGSQAHREKLKKDHEAIYGPFMPHVKRFVIIELVEGREVAVVKKLNSYQHVGDAIWESKMMGWESHCKGENKTFHWRPLRRTDE